MTVARRTLLLVGIAFTAWLVSSVGAHELTTNLWNIGWGFTIILAQELLAFGANTLGWWLVFPSGQRPALDLRLVRVRMASDAVNYATPTAGLAGEVVRVDLVKNEIAPAAATASVTVAKLTQALGQAMYITGGILIGASLLPALQGPPGSALRTAVVLLWAGIAAFLVVQRNISLELLLRRFGRSRGSIEFARDVDSNLRDIHSCGPALAASVICFAFGWATGAIEVWTVLVCLGLERSIASAVAIDASIALVDAVLFFMPLKLVALEGGAVTVFQWAGIGGAAGLAFGLARRVRQVAWVVVGLGLLALEDWRAFRHRRGGGPARDPSSAEGSSVDPAPTSRLRDPVPPVMQARRTSSRSVD